MEFLKKTWVTIMAFVFIIIGVVVLILGGTSVGEINSVVELIAGVLSAIGLLIVAIKKLLQKKDTTNKQFLFMFFFTAEKYMQPMSFQLFIFFIFRMEK